MYISQVKDRVGEEIELRGWVYRKRESGGIIFVIIRDHTGIIQISIKKDNVDANSWNDANETSIESSIKVRGIIKEDPRAPGNYEIEAKEFKLIHKAEPFPITEYQSPELLLDFRHLWLRSQKMTKIMRIRSYVFRYIREFLDERDFYEITPPILTKAGGETGADLFEVKYFNEKAYLTESSQLYAEAMIFSLEKVYSFAPSFRAEKSRTVKHLAEYWHLEPEMAYYDMYDNMKLQEELVSYIAQSLARDHADLLKDFNVNIEELKGVEPPFPRYSYKEALDILKEKGSDKKWGDDFGVEEEKLLTMDQTKPIFIHHWPSEIKAFYMPDDPEYPGTVKNADMLAPKGHGEIIGGSERIWKLDELLDKMKKFKLNIENYDWYIDLRKYGSVPHSGFGMGVERVIKWLLNLDHIRDAIPFPRVINRVKP